MSEEPVMQGAIVEIVDPSSTNGRGPLLPRAVYVNGTHVGFTKGVVVNAGGKDELTTVELVLVPRQVIIRGESA